MWEGYGLGLAIGDVNRNGFPDIYVSNDYLTNDLLYMNNGDGSFTNEIDKLLSYQTRSSMGNDMADVNNDGFIDIYTLDMLPESFHKQRQTINGFSYRNYIMDRKLGYEHQYVRNMLHLSNGALKNKLLPFSEVGQITDLHQTEWSWSSLFADYDNDGDKDLIVTNGYPRDMTDKDWLVMRSTMANSGKTEAEILPQLPKLEVCNMAFENCGELSFRKRKDWLPQIPSYSYGAAFVDLDNDGDLDHVSNNFNAEAFVFENTTINKSRHNSSFIRINLKGKQGNTMALGAKVELWQRGTYQYAENYLSRGYASSVDPIVHFGLSYNQPIDSIKIIWPTNKEYTLLKEINNNQLLEVAEVDDKGKKPVVKNEAAKPTIFEDVSEVLSYNHEQTDFIDFFMGQKIIPHKFSQVGPAMCKGDLNGDGAEDLIIGASNSAPTMVFLNHEGHFTRDSFPGLTHLKECTVADLLCVDFDKDGDDDVFAVSGGYEIVRESKSQSYHFMNSGSKYDERIEKKFKHFVYENQEGKFVPKELPIPPFIASIVRPCDYNKDGFVDLFVGARVKRGKFPHSNNSWLINNNQGNLTTDSTTSFSLGMVTDAVWTDYDNDGWTDLMIARQFNSLLLLKNMHGEKLVPQEIECLKNKNGFWYSVIAADFDEDGDEDYIVGNLGLNAQVEICDKYPMHLYSFDLDNNGIYDPIRTAYWKNSKGKKEEYFVNFLDELSEQSPYFKSRFKDYTSFSYTSVEEVFGKNIPERVEKYLYANTAASEIIWNDNGTFRWERLPIAAQVSPISKMLVKDFNNDGYLDVLAGGNDHSHELAAGLYDANKGLLMLNCSGNSKCDSSFEVVHPAQSGIVLDGMVGGLLHFSGSPALIVAGINRSEAKVFRFLEKELEGE